MMLNYRNTQIYYTSKGIGNPIVLLHGFLESSNIWNFFLPALSEKRQVICIDLPGHGKSGNLEAVHSMELMADTVHHVLTHLNIEKATLVGHSMGGYVCLAYSEIFPIMTSGLALINSTPEEDSEERKEIRDRAASLVMRNKSAFVNMAISNLLSPENSLKFKSEIKELTNEALDFSTEGIIAAIIGMKIRTNKMELLKTLQIQKFIVAGKNDPVMNYNRVKSVAKYCKCKFASLEDGHLSYLENQHEIQIFLHFID